MSRLAAGGTVEGAMAAAGGAVAEVADAAADRLAALDPGVLSDYAFMRNELPNARSRRGVRCEPA